MIAAHVLIILCGLAALVYGVITSRQVLAADAGSARMQEISGAVQEGARAYLNRQYTTIGMVGVVILIVLGVILGVHVAIGFLITGEAGEMIFPPITLIGIFLLWVSAIFTIYTGWDYFRAGIHHLIEEDEG